MSADIVDHVDETISTLHVAAFHHGAFQPKTHEGRLRLNYTHTPSSQGKNHAKARAERDQVMDELRQSVDRLRDVVRAAGAMWAEYFADTEPDEITQEQAAFIAALGMLQQQDVGNTAVIAASSGSPMPPDDRRTS